MNLTHAYFNPANMTALTIGDFHTLSGAKLNRVKRAAALGFLYANDVPIGTLALKVPFQSYKERLGVSGCSYELGYAAVLPSYKAAARLPMLQLAVALLTPVQDADIFATTRVNNEVEIALPALGFVKRGEPYDSVLEGADHQCQLWVRTA